jgi:hypothetical protein
LFLFQRQKVSFFTTGDEAFCDRFQLFPTSANLLRFFLRDLIIRGSARNDCQQVRELLNDLIGCGDEVRRVRLVDFRIQNEEASGALANPLHQAAIAGAPEQRVDPIERVGAAASRNRIRRFRPLINHGKRKAQICGYLFGAALLKNLAQDFVRLHKAIIGKANAD